MRDGGGEHKNKHKGNPENDNVKLKKNLIFYQIGKI